MRLTVLRCYVDVWALGVMLYKLCYYATPFEGNTALPILSVSYSIPSHPVYSSSIKGLIGKDRYFEGLRI